MNARPVGLVTRGTTAHRRLRRADRWLLATYGTLLRRRELLVVDLGFGDRPVTTVELAARLRRVNSTCRVIGLDISTERVAAARQSTNGQIQVGLGGFELAGHRPDVVRAFNVLRQYDEDDVAAAWARMQRQLTPGGIVLDGTCDETGRLASWVTLDAAGPQSLTIAVDLSAKPSTVATRLPKALIHRNVPGEQVHRLLADLDAGWAAHAALGVFSPRQRFVAAARELKALGWPLSDGPRRWGRGDVTVAWSALGASAR